MLAPAAAASDALGLEEGLKPLIDNGAIHRASGWNSMNR
jgi:hypothetical protein